MFQCLPRFPNASTNLPADQTCPSCLKTCFAADASRPELSPRILFLLSLQDPTLFHAPAQTAGNCLNPSCLWTCFRRSLRTLARCRAPSTSRRRPCFCFERRRHFRSSQHKCCVCLKSHPPGMASRTNLPRGLASMCFRTLLCTVRSSCSSDFPSGLSQAALRIGRAPAPTMAESSLAAGPTDVHPLRRYPKPLSTGSALIQ